MEQIWAPWRIQYILEGYKDGGCLFCDVRDTADDRKHFVLERRTRSLVLFNLFPYNNAHLMCAPFRHLSNFDELDDQEILEMGQSMQKWIKVIRKVMKPDGFNLGLNLGKVAGAGFDQHIHHHIVPRWNGDTNFMPVIANTSVIPESLDVTYEKLPEASRGEL